MPALPRYSSALRRAPSSCCCVIMAPLTFTQHRVSGLRSTIARSPCRRNLQKCLQEPGHSGTHLASWSQNVGATASTRCSFSPKPHRDATIAMVKGPERVRLSSFNEALSGWVSRRSSNRSVRRLGKRSGRPGSGERSRPDHMVDDHVSCVRRHVVSSSVRSTALGTSYRTVPMSVGSAETTRAISVCYWCTPFHTMLPALSGPS